MPSILISAVEFGATPVNSQLADVFYKLAGTPDYPGNYTLVAADVPVSITGQFVTPVKIQGLNMGENYTVKVVTKCGVNFKKDMSIPFCYLSFNDCILAYRGCKLYID